MHRNFALRTTNVLVLYAFAEVLPHPPTAPPTQSRVTPRNLAQPSPALAGVLRVSFSPTLFSHTQLHLTPLNSTLPSPLSLVPPHRLPPSPAPPCTPRTCWSPCVFPRARPSPAPPSTIPDAPAIQNEPRHTRHVTHLSVNTTCPCQRPMHDT